MKGMDDTAPKEIRALQASLRDARHGGSQDIDSLTILREVRQARTETHAGMTARADAASARYPFVRVLY